MARDARLEDVWERLPAHYMNLEYLRLGSFAAVCKATDRRTGQRVALKKAVRPFLDELRAKSLFRELAMLSGVSHANIVRAYDMFFIQDPLETHIFLCMELMASNLAEVMKSQLLSPPHIQAIVSQILRALEYLHSMGIIHRDLKPDNIGINRDVTVKLFDFGLARACPPNATADAANTFTPRHPYASPECFLSLNFDHKTDIWAVGCILGELLEGWALFPFTDWGLLVGRWYALLGPLPPGPICDRTTQLQLTEPTGLSFMLDPLPQHQWTAASEPARGLLLRLLSINSAARPTAAEALCDPFLAPPQIQQLLQRMEEALDQRPAAAWADRACEEVAAFMAGRLNL